MAAIAILGVILVGVMLAKARHTHQLEMARQRCAAVDVADELIAGWWTSPEGVPVGKNGTVEGHTSLTWTIAEVDNAPMQALGARVMRVTLRPARHADAADALNVEPLVVVDLVLPADHDTQSERPDYD